MSGFHFEIHEDVSDQLNARIRDSPGDSPGRGLTVRDRQPQPQFFLTQGQRYGFDHLSENIPPDLEWIPPIPSRPANQQPQPILVSGGSPIRPVTTRQLLFGRPIGEPTHFQLYDNSPRPELQGILPPQGVVGWKRPLLPPQLAPPPPRARRRSSVTSEEESIPLEFALPPESYLSDLPSPPVLREGYLGRMYYDLYGSYVPPLSQEEEDQIDDYNFDQSRESSDSPLRNAEGGSLEDEARGTDSLEHHPLCPNWDEFVFSPVNIEDIDYRKYLHHEPPREDVLQKSPSAIRKEIHELRETTVSSSDLAEMRVKEESWDISSEDMHRTPEVMRGGRDDDDPYQGMWGRGQSTPYMSHKKIPKRNIEPDWNPSPRPPPHSTPPSPRSYRNIGKLISPIRLATPPPPPPTPPPPFPPLPVISPTTGSEMYSSPPPPSPYVPHLFTPSPDRPRLHPILAPEVKEFEGVPTYYLETQKCKGSTWRKKKRSPLPLLRRPLPEKLSPSMMSTDYPLGHYPKGMVSLSGSVLQKSIDESSIMDDLEVSLNESLVAQSSWISWRSGLHPPLPGFRSVCEENYEVQKPIQPEDAPKEKDKHETLNTECMYYASLLNRHSLNLKDQQTRDVVAKWVRKLFGPEYHAIPALQEKRNRYLLALTICVISNNVLDLFLQPPPEGPLGDPDLGADERRLARWEKDDLWNDVLSGLPDPEILEQPCQLHPPGSPCPESGTAKGGLEGKRGGGGMEKDMKESSLLDKEYHFLLYLAKGLASQLDQAFEKTMAASWLHALCAVADDTTATSYATKKAILGADSWPCSLKRGVRNEYIQALLAYLLEWRLDGPFLRAPPNNGNGGPLPTLRSAAISTAKLMEHNKFSPTSSLADKFLFKQPVPKEGAFCFVALSGDSLNVWFPDCKAQGDAPKDKIIRTVRSKLEIEYEDLF